VADRRSSAGGQFDPTLVAIFVERVLPGRRPRLEAVS
jgi:hypothetical protein